MLTIKNFQRLKGKVIGNTGYYVEFVKPVISLDPNSGRKHNWYWIELTNRKQITMVQLEREGFDTDDIGVKLYELKLGRKYINLPAYKLRDMDLVVDKINQLILEQYVP